MASFSYSFRALRRPASLKYPLCPYFIPTLIRPSGVGGAAFGGARRYGYLHDMLLQHPIEEEMMPGYEKACYYPVEIGDVYAERYEVVGKLGYGASSTCWLCRDRQTASYKAVKITTALSEESAVPAELTVYKHINAVIANSTHPGRHLIRPLHDTFLLSSPSGQHHGLVQLPMYTTIRNHARRFPNSLLPIHDAKRLIRNLLWVLDFLHTEAKVVHTDIKTDNLMLTIEDGGMLSDFIAAEKAEPTRRRDAGGGRGTYRSREFREPRGLGWGTTMLCDFGDARIGSLQAPCPTVQPVVYRAPEVVFEMAWGIPADIWNLAALVWEIIQGERLFSHILDVTGDHDAFKHVARMVALMGRPPNMFLQRSAMTMQCFDRGGAWIATEAEVPIVSLDSLEQRYGEDPVAAQEKDQFLNFMAAILQWLPEQRPTASELLRHPWLSHVK